MNIIEINGLTKYYGKHRGVEDLSFSVKEGEIFGFIGPNGAGKSTTIRTMLNLIAPTKGSIEIFGKDSRKDAALIAEDIGYLPSEVYYYEEMKVGELLAYSASFYKKDCKKRIAELSELLELDLSRKIEDLSYGNRKKVGIVQGLLHDPRLIILDEPTSGLDPLMQQKFFHLLKEENERGKTIFFSSHILSEVQKLCHRVAILREGHLVKLDEINNLRDESYRRFTLETKEGSLEELLAVEGITHVTRENHTVSFIYKGDMSRILPFLAQAPLRDMLIEEPSLEEVFLHYYEKEDQK
ncbi:ABC transporter ATP-binding protein [Proteiniclasticum sp. BAD-10]|uniref:ABC transporter ATP-binding protein n=1 Tax=Proteiniclasticum sediminis TaxID=2804028 RepID=A0A941HQZ5_9CLOT|nr:ABC transporter ATP-binding protein [Proteiniclasticum sediminis]MBR0577019.1 ABC transporter ATP-binding protein [Proteiniclasticum sediminis]